MSKLIFLLTITLVVNPKIIYANIKDFIIENENDLQRFGVGDTEQQYDDDLDNDWMQDSCGAGGDVGNPYGDYVGNDGELDASQIDPRLLKEIVRQMKQDPRFEHLWDQLSEENIMLERSSMTPSYGDYEEPSDFYVDVDENYQGGDNYEIE